MSALKYWLWLSSAEVSANSKGAFISHYGDAETGFFAPVGEYAKIPGISLRDAAILEKRSMDRVERIFEACEIQNIDIISYQDALYPKRLKNVFAPPPVLYVKGRFREIDDNAVIAVIGTRKASYYGIKMSTHISREIAQCGGVIVSGLNRGIDYASAEAALLADGVVISVLGTAHEQDKCPISPDIAVKGALISEYAPGTASQRSFFRERNRITAGLSVGVVVVEAPEGSNTRLFVNEAHDQGKELFAVPGNADSANSVGTLDMLKDGAKLVTCGWEVLNEFEWLFPGKLKYRNTLTEPMTFNEPEAPAKKSGESAQPQESSKKVIDNEKPTGYIDLKEQLSSLTEDQLRIVTAIDAAATHVDDIIEATGLPTATVLAQLTILEIRGYVRRDAGRRISLNIAKK